MSVCSKSPGNKACLCACLEENVFSVASLTPKPDRRTWRLVFVHRTDRTTTRAKP